MVFLVVQILIWRFGLQGSVRILEKGFEVWDSRFRVEEFRGESSKQKASALPDDTPGARTRVSVTALHMS